MAISSIHAFAPAGPPRHQKNAILPARSADPVGVSGHHARESGLLQPSAHAGPLEPMVVDARRVCDHFRGHRRNAVSRTTLMDGRT
jgi:hypothetical protein